MDKRVERSRNLVLDAGTALLADEGYSAFTVDAIVTRTGVAKTTIYRHWATRSDLLAAVMERMAQQFPPADTGSVRADLLEYFTVRTHRMDRHSDRRLQSLPGMLEAARSDPTVAVHSSLVLRSLLNGVGVMLERGRARGEIRADRDLDVMADIILGAIFIRRGFRNQDFTNEYIAEAMDTILEGVAPSRV
jgi:AcrR family transcriptional regulator